MKLAFISHFGIFSEDFYQIVYDLQARYDAGLHCRFELKIELNC